MCGYLKAANTEQKMEKEEFLQCYRHSSYYWKGSRQGLLSSMLHAFELLLIIMADCVRQALATWLTAGWLSRWIESRLIQWCHFVSPTQLTYTYENKYANRRVYSHMILYSNEHSLHHEHCHLLLRTTLYKSSQLHPTFWQEAPFHFYSPSLPENKNPQFFSPK